MLNSGKNSSIQKTSEDEIDCLGNKELPRSSMCHSRHSLLGLLLKLPVRKWLGGPSNGSAYCFYFQIH